MKNFTPTPLEIILYWPSVFAEVILRKNFGKHYLPQQSRKQLSIIFLAPIADYFEPLISPYSKGVVWFLIVCAVRTLFELARVQMNKQKKAKIDANHSGSPLSVWQLVTKDESFTRTILEPSLFATMGVAFIAMNFDVILGYILAAIGLSLYLKEQFYVKRTLAIKTAIENAKRKQEAITNGETLADYDHQPEGMTPNPEELTSSITDAVKNIGWKG